jgi:malonyl-CoA O-methyltransferase
MSVTPSPEIGDPLPPLDAQATLYLAAKTSRAGEPWLHNEVARRMAQRLALIRHPVKHWLHWDSRAGGLASQHLLEGIFPKANCMVVQTQPRDLTWASQSLQQPWWRSWLGPQRRFGLQADDAADMLWSNMGLHMQPRPAQAMLQWAQSLHADGFVMFSCLGPDSLRELRPVFDAMGWPTPSHAFTDMHDWGDMLLGAGFAAPIMDMEHITLTYASPQALLKDLRSLGRNLNPHRFQACRGRAWLNTLHQQLQNQLCSAKHDGRLALTFEVIYGHAFKAPVRLTVKPETRVSLDQLKAQLKSD